MVAEPGQRLFADGTIPMAFKVTESTVAPNGVIVVKCERTGATGPGATASAVVSNSSGAGFPRIAGCTNGTGHGGIYTVGALYVVSSTTAANATGDGGVQICPPGLIGARGGDGGGVYNGGDAAIVANTLVANRTGAGGDAGGSHGVGGNGGNGAGLYTTGNAALFNMTVADNCTGAGGMGGVPGGGEGGHGGGIWNAGAATLDNVTAVDNCTGKGGASFSPDIAPGAGGKGGGLLLDALATTTVRNSVLGGNTSAGLGPDCFGSLTSYDYNLVGDAASCTMNGATMHTLIGVAPVLSLLDDHGGPTWTAMPAAFSPLARRRELHRHRRRNHRH